MTDYLGQEGKLWCSMTNGWNNFLLIWMSSLLTPPQLGIHLSILSPPPNKHAYTHTQSTTFPNYFFKDKPHHAVSLLGSKMCRWKPLCFTPLPQQCSLFNMHTQRELSLCLSHTCMHPQIDIPTHDNTNIHCTLSSAHTHTHTQAHTGCPSVSHTHAHIPRQALPSRVIVRPGGQMQTKPPSVFSQRPL